MSKITHMGFKSAKTIHEEREQFRVSSVEGIAQILVEKHSHGFSVEKFDKDLTTLASRHGLMVLDFARNARLAILKEFHFLRGVRIFD